MRIRETFTLSGADRFQLFFDNVSRKNTGTGNVIRAMVVVDGVIPENKFHELVERNEAILFLSNLSLVRKWFSPVYKWKLSGTKSKKQILSIHKSGVVNNIVRRLQSKDCSFDECPIYIDIVYGSSQTSVFISANHALFDYSGMENLLSIISGDSSDIVLKKTLAVEGSFLKKMTDAIAAALFIAKRSGRNIRRLLKNKDNPKAALGFIELSKEETQKTSLRHHHEIKTGLLPYYLGNVVYSLSGFESLLSHRKGDFFVAVPIDRRPVSHKNVLLSNYLSFIYFKVKFDEIESVKNVAGVFSKQMIQQGRKRIPEKFRSLLYLFRFLPDFIYRTFIELPGKGHSNTFAFSLLANSGLENKLFMGLPVRDVTHFPPVISPPGLNIVFTEFNGRLKIICSFDESRITRDQVNNLLEAIGRNLLSSDV